MKGGAKLVQYKSEASDERCEKRKREIVTCYVRKDRNTILVATHKNGLYHARVTPDNQKEAALATVDINLLHRRMGHISTNRIQHMVKSGQLQGIDTLVGTPIFCEACVLGKMKKLPFESPLAHLRWFT